MSDGDIREDADRLRAAHEALAGFCFAVEHGKPKSRLGTLGLGEIASDCDGKVSGAISRQIAAAVRADAASAHQMVAP
jgi:hypothetical protein